jgi:hypothetical protein
MSIKSTICPKIYMVTITYHLPLRIFLDNMNKMLEFRSFFEDLNLVDLPLLGRHFTWFHANGLSMSLIDRVLVSLDWIQLCVNVSLWVCPRDVSDHCPLVVKVENND